MGDIVESMEKFRRGWTGGLPETPCGSGSMLANTVKQREWIASMIRRYAIRSIADIGAGDLNWISHMDMSDIHYTAYDLVPRHQNVIQFDITRQIPPGVDLILCLWVLNHLPIDECRKAIANLRASGSYYLLMTDRPKWHHEQPVEILMQPIEILPLRTDSGDRLLLIELS